MSNLLVPDYVPFGLHNRGMFYSVWKNDKLRAKNKPAYKRKLIKKLERAVAYYESFNHKPPKLTLREIARLKYRKEDEYLYMNI